MYENLTPNIIALIYEYDPTYRAKFNIVLEELKILILFKFLPEYNLTDGVKWCKIIRKIEPSKNDTVIHFNKTHLRLLKEEATPEDAIT